MTAGRFTFIQSTRNCRTRSADGLGLIKFLWAERAIFVELGRELIRTAPAYDPDQIIGHDDAVRLYAHYGKSMQATADSGQAKDGS